MAEPGEPAGLLANLIDGRVAPNDAPFELVALFRLARQCGQIEVPGPPPGAAARMRSRFADIQDGRSGYGGWAGGFASRPLAGRLAAGALVVAVAGGGASITTGVTPLDAARATGEFVHSLVLNLDPRDGGGDSSPGSGATPAVSATPTGRAQPSVTPSPGAATVTAGANGGPPPLAGGPGPTTAGPNGTPAPAATPRTTPSAVTGVQTATSTPSTQAPGDDREEGLADERQTPPGTATGEASPAPGSPGGTPTPDGDDSEDDGGSDDDETPGPGSTPEEDDA